MATVAAVTQQTASNSGPVPCEQPSPSPFLWHAVVLHALSCAFLCAMCIEVLVTKHDGGDELYPLISVWVVITFIMPIMQCLALKTQFGSETERGARLCAQLSYCMPVIIVGVCIAISMRIWNGSARANTLKCIILLACLQIVAAFLSFGKTDVRKYDVRSRAIRLAVFTLFLSAAYVVTVSIEPEMQKKKYLHYGHLPLLGVCVILCVLWTLTARREILFPRRV